LPLLLLVGNTRMRITIVEAHKGAVNFINIGVLQHQGSCSCCSPCYGLSIRRPTLGQRLSTEGERDIPQTSIRQPSPSSPPPPPLTSTSSFNKSITRSSLGRVSQKLFNIPFDKIRSPRGEGLFCSTRDPSRSEWVESGDGGHQQRTDEYLSNFQGHPLVIDRPRFSF
jgi:hypothetical protein